MSKVTSCSKETCTTTLFCRGLCRRHYQALRRSLPKLEIDRHGICALCSVPFYRRVHNQICCSRKCAVVRWKREKGRKYFRNRYAQDKEKFKQYTRIHRRKQKHQCYMAYGGYKCACPPCGETNPKFLTLDHINNDGASHRRSLSKKKVKAGPSLYTWIIKNNFPPLFQVLCYNCNCGKNINRGVCPHFGAVNG